MTGFFLYRSRTRFRSSKLWKQTIDDTQKKSVSFHDRRGFPQKQNGQHEPIGSDSSSMGTWPTLPASELMDKTKARFTRVTQSLGESHGIGQGHKLLTQHRQRHRRKSDPGDFHD